MTASRRRKNRREPTSTTAARPESGRPSGARTRSTGRASRSSEPDLAARLTRAERKLARDLGTRESLLDMMRAVNVPVRSVEIAAAALSRAEKWWSAPGWVLLTADQLSSYVDMRTAGDLPLEAESAMRGIADWVLTHGADFKCASLKADPRIAATVDGSAFALALNCRERTVGALVAFDPSASSREPRLGAAALTSVAVLLEVVAAALDNACLVERAEALSVTDDLTHLYNSRYLNQVLRRETKRAARSGRPLSLLFIDLDGFKSINDTYGHVSGSRALVEAGAVIRGSARETDIAARFGGDEFALILPDTGAPGALAVAERVRERIASHVFLRPEGYAARLTASVGVATLPEAAATAEELVQAADAAMYLVKDRGKNGTHVASQLEG